MLIDNLFETQDIREKFKKFLQDIPNSPGVYFYKDVKNTIIYIGKAKNLRKRIFSYFRKANDFKTAILVPNIRYIDFMVTDTEEEALLWENTLIKRFMPRYNIDLKDDKTYPYLKITNEKYPKIYITRKIDDDDAEYFGPYVDVATLKDILFLVKKVFNIWKCRKNLTKKEKRPCLNYFMGRCLAPCYFDIDEKYYKNIINDIKDFIKFDYKKLIKRWTKDIKDYSNKMEFEKAEVLKQKILAINKLKNRSFDIKVWKIKKTDLEKIQQIYQGKKDELAKLENILSLPKKIKTIAGFDISNISGKYAVGSRVVFVDGKPCKSMYRKYKIKTVCLDKPNDFAMMAEVLDRSLNASDIDKIDLILIDGGKGQLNAAVQIMRRHKKDIPIISIAKKQEIIFLENQKNGIQLEMDSEILKLIRYIRDESHRFAISYHRKLRSKNFLKT
ncbi:MAG: excinuclease ABC subunit UvrC [Elusimicrobiota bacterium]|jgi:excinuclease ABC subunit C|nr:excinuclease ABC subunit UvrC [Elusimicrobiota bacterium]